MTRWTTLLLLAGGFLAGALAFAPLEAVLKLGGARERGLNWASAEGTVFEGHLKGIEIAGTTYGDTRLKLIPSALITGRLKFDVDWTGEHGDGAGDVSIGGGDYLSLQDFSIDLDLLQLQQAARWIQQSGGRIRIQGKVVRFKRGQCIEASGIAQSDVLERSREILGTGWSEMRGELRCENGQLVVPLESANSTGTLFRAQLRVSPGQQGSFDAHVSGLIPRELIFALPIAGFTADGRDFVYTYSPPQRTGPT